MQNICYCPLPNLATTINVKRQDNQKCETKLKMIVIYDFIDNKNQSYGYVD